MKAKQHEINLLPLFEKGVNMADFRKLKRGDVLLVRASRRKPSGALLAASDITKAASITGCKVTQRTMVLTDSVTYESIPVIMVVCLEEPNGN